MKTNKKGQTFELIGGAAVGIAVLVLVLVVAMLIASNVKTTSGNQITSTTYTGVYKTMTNATTTEFPECIDTETMIVNTIYNGTGRAAADIVIQGPGINYTVSYNKITMNVSDLGAYLSPANITYSCKYPSYAFNQTKVLTASAAQIPGWVPLIVIIMIGAIVIGLVQRFRQ